jgi:hypothetical protein
MSDIEEELFYFDNEELDASYQNVYMARNIYEYIKEMCKDTELFSELLEDELYEFLYPSCSFAGN